MPIGRPRLRKMLRTFRGGRELFGQPTSVRSAPENTHRTVSVGRKCDSFSIGRPYRFDISAALSQGANLGFSRQLIYPNITAFIILYLHGKHTAIWRKTGIPILHRWHAQKFYPTITIRQTEAAVAR